MSVLSSSAAASGEISGEETAAVAANHSAACCYTPGNTVPPLSLTHTKGTLLSTYTEKEASALENQSYTEIQKMFQYTKTYD